MTDFDVEQIVTDFLRVDVPTHKRRCAIRQGLREPDATGCTHENWDHCRHWCNDCGVTKRELVMQRLQTSPSGPAVR